MVIYTFNVCACGDLYIHMCVYMGSVYAHVCACVLQDLSGPPSLSTSAVSISTIFYSSLSQISPPLSLSVFVYFSVSPGPLAFLLCCCCCLCPIPISPSPPLSLSLSVSIFFCIFEIPHPLILRSRCLHQYFSLPLSLSSVFKSLEHWFTAHSLQCQSLVPLPLPPLSPPPSPACFSPLIPPFQAKGRGIWARLAPLISPAPLSS